MLRFTDQKLFVKGTASAYLQDGENNIVYFSDKFQTGTIATSVTAGEIRGGLGNPELIELPTDGSITVTFNAADFSLFAKAAQTGAALSYGAPVMVCQTVTASGESLAIDVTDGTPVAPIGSSDIYCFVQEVGAASPVAAGGVAYTLSAAGAVSGFVATASKQYKVWYWVNRANAHVAAISSNIDPKVLRFTAEIPVYSSESGGANRGTMVGKLTVVIPRLKLGGDAGGVVGDQTTADTTNITGKALAADEAVIAEDCAECAGFGTPLAYYIYSPCDLGSGIEGIVAQLGGVITMAKSASYQIMPRAVVNGELAYLNPADCTYEITTSISGCSVSEAGVITSGTTAGDGEVTVTYTVGTESYTDVCNLSVTA